MGVVEEIKNSLDIVAVVSRYVNLRKAGRNFKALCPFHPEKTPSFYVFPDRQGWHCFGACGAGGDLFSFLMKKEGIGFGEALQSLAAQAGISLPEKGKEGVEEGFKARLKEINEAAALYFHNLLFSRVGRAALSYLLGRGINEETAREFMLGYSLDSRGDLQKHLRERGYTEDDLLAAGLLVQGEGGNYDRFRGRLMFPIRDPKGRVVGLGARALDDSLPKYLNSPQTPIFDKSSLLYGLDKAKAAMRQKDLAVIVEGYMDAISAHQHGATNVVASMGTSLTEKQVGLLRGITKNLALALDADAAGDAATLRGVVVASQALGRKVVPRLTWQGRVQYQGATDGEVWVVVLPRGKDPDLIFREEPEVWPGLIEGRLPLMDYVFEAASAKFNLARPQDKAQLVEELIPIIGEVRNPIQQVYYLQRLGRLVGVDEGVLRAALPRKDADGTPRRRKAALASEEKALPLPNREVMEEYCLALLLQNPYLRAAVGELRPEHFFTPENCQLYTAWQEVSTLEELQESLDPALEERFSYLISFEIPPMGEEECKKALAHCAYRLEERRLRDVNRKLQFLIEEQEKELSEANLQGDSGPSGAEKGVESLLHLQRQAVEVSSRLGELFKRLPF